MNAFQSNRTASQIASPNTNQMEKRKGVCMTIKDHERIAANNPIPNTKEH
jgi:hypothetical protein